LTRDLEHTLRAELRRCQHGLNEPALSEALRLLGSPRVRELTERHVREVAEYRPIELAGERFFERAWTRSKEAGAMLGFALLLGADAVRQELLTLAATLGRTSG
jgi:hypothetical protein